LAVRETDRVLTRQYTPGPYDGETLLVRAEAPAVSTLEELGHVLDPVQRSEFVSLQREAFGTRALGWDGWASRLTVVSVPGDHYRILSAESASRVGAAVNARLSSLSVA